MAVPRSIIVDLETTSYYHVMSKCVRGSFLCGIDPKTQEDYSHRKQWIEDRIKQLAYAFAIQVASYVVMSNHFHLVLFVDEELGKSLTNEEVLERWKSIFPTDAKKIERMDEMRKFEKINACRGKLIDLSWFMRCLNEYIAKRANGEEKCEGRFWAGRFKSQALLDPGAIITTSAYVDLNPLRAGIAKTPEDSEFTSIKQRVDYSAKQVGKKSKSKPNPPLKQIYDTLDQPNYLMSFLNPENKKETKIKLPITFSEYLEVVDYTARLIRTDGKASMPESVAPIFERLGLRGENWWQYASHLGTNFSYAVGNLTKYRTFGKTGRKGPNKGSAIARACYL